MPKNWKTYKLEDLGTIITGKTPSSKHPEHFGNHLPFVTPTDFSDYHKNVSFASRYLSKEGVKHFKSKILPPNSILVTCIGSQMGKVVVNKLEVLTNQQLNSIIPNKNANSDFLYYKLSSIHEQLRTMAGAGSTMPMLNKSDFGKIEIVIPEIEEQKQIASILSALDDKIELNLQMNKTLEEMAMALYKHWFVDFGPFQDGEFVASELGEIPKGWEEKSIGQVVKIIGGFAFKSKDFKEIGETVVKIKNISNNVVSIEGSDCIGYNIGAKTNKKFLIQPGSFLIAMTGAEVGKVGVVPDYGRKLWLNQRVGIITAPSFESADILIGNFLQHSDGYETIQNLAYGSAQPNISTNGLESISLPIPNDITIIADFLKKISSWHQMKISNYTENQTLTQLRDTLLPKLISGEVRVKDVEKTLTEVI